MVRGDLNIIYLHTRYGNNIGSHPKNSWLETINSIRKRLLRLHSLKPKYCNYKVLLGLIISIIRQLNSLLVFPNSAEALSKFYTRRICDKAIVYIILPWRSDLMADKGLNILLHVSPQAVRKKECTYSSWGDSKMHTSGTIVNLQKKPTDINENSAISKVRIVVKPTIL